MTGEPITYSEGSQSLGVAVGVLLVQPKLPEYKLRLPPCPARWADMDTGALILAWAGCQAFVAQLAEGFVCSVL